MYNQLKKAMNDGLLTVDEIIADKKVMRIKNAVVNDTRKKYAQRQKRWKKLAKAAKNLHRSCGHV